MLRHHTECVRIMGIKTTQVVHLSELWTATQYSYRCIYAFEAHQGINCNGCMKFETNQFLYAPLIYYGKKQFLISWFSVCYSTY